MKWLLLIVLFASGAVADTLIEVKKEIFRISTSKGGLATGFAIKTSNGRVFMITNWHVCQDAEDGVLYASHESKPDLKLPMRVIKSDEKKDLCILGFKSRGLKPAPKYSLGTKVFTIGHPHAQDTQEVKSGTTVARSTVTLPFKSQNFNCPASMTKVNDFPYPKCLGEIEVIDTTMKCVAGCSGSPVLDFNGEVVGVINSTWTKDHTLYGSMIPLEVVKDFLKEY